MTRKEALEKVLAAYAGYYNIIRDSVTSGFSAEAVFDLKDEQYVLVKRAKISEAISKEFVFFADTGLLTEELLMHLADTAWESGLARVEPVPNHRNSDITLFIIADSVGPTAAACVRKLRRSKTYMLGFRGWSNFRVIVCDLSSGKAVHNRLGAELKKTADNIFQPNKKQ